MKKSILFSCLLAVAGASLTGCQESYENVSDHNNVWNPVTDPVTTIFLDGKTDVSTQELSVKMAQPVDYEVKVTYDVNSSKVEDYNAIYGSDAIILPSEYYDFSNNVATIDAGSVTSTSAKISFLNLKSLDESCTYVLPVSIVDANMGVLKSRETSYYVFRASALVNVVADMTGTYVSYVKPGQAPMLSSMTKMTFEALIYPETFLHPDAGENLTTLMGTESEFLIRVGDVGIEANQIQISTADSKKFTSTSWLLDTHKWTFLTVAIDLEEKTATVYFNGLQKGGVESVTYPGPIDWNVADCYIGYSFNNKRDFQGYMSEVRVWNKILTPAEINEPNHFYRVDPESEGLVAYWKFDEGSGNLVHDYANGYDMYVPATWPGGSDAPSSIGWVQVTLPPAE